MEKDELPDQINVSAVVAEIRVLSVKPGDLLLVTLSNPEMAVEAEGALRKALEMAGISIPYLVKGPGVTVEIIRERIGQWQRRRHHRRARRA